ncbi:MAG: hypothetical protein L6Q38_17375, partial [Nitrospira sp.]|nr:hypothetical protein [Nitrospira sp.]
SVKRFFGHTLAASGAIKAVVCVQALMEQATPGNPGFVVADPELNLEPAREFQQRPVARVISSSFGFGGNNVALVFSRADQRPATGDQEVAGTAESRRRRVDVLGVGVVSPSGQALDAVWSTLERGGAPATEMEVAAVPPVVRVPVHPCGDIAATHFPDPSRRRRWNRIQQMILSAGYQTAGPELRANLTPARTTLAVGTGLGALNDTMAFVENMVANDERAPRPTFFTNSVHNSLASQVAIEMGITGANVTTVQREVSFEAALWHGALGLRRNRCDLALVGGADELSPHALAVGSRWGWWSAERVDRATRTGLGRRPRGSGRMAAGEGAVMVALGEAAPGGDRLATVAGVRLGRMAWKAGDWLDADLEAHWVASMLESAEVVPGEVDLWLTGANGWEPMEAAYAAVHRAWERRVGRSIPMGRYKQGCGEFPAASAFGFLVATGLVAGRLNPASCVSGGDWEQGRPCRTVVLHTISPWGCKGITCLRA